MDMTTNLDLTLEVGPDFSQMIRLVTDSQKTYVVTFVIKRVCDVSQRFLKGTLNSLELLVVFSQEEHNP